MLATVKFITYGVVWMHSDNKEQVDITPDWYQQNGTPVCPDCNEDMEYVRTEIEVTPKEYNVRMNVGSAKYLVSYHNGFETHKDGSSFFGVKIFKNKKKMDSFLKKLKGQGYNER